MSNLLARARADIEISKILLTDRGNPTHDEMITDQAAYHAQQAIEKALKFQMEMQGIGYKKVHNLSSLISPLVSAGFPIPCELRDKAFLISSWESSSRYGDDFSVIKSDIEDAIKLYEKLEFLILDELEKNSTEQNQVCEKVKKSELNDMNQFSQ